MTQDRPAMSDTKDNPSNDDEARKPAAKNTNTTPTPDGAPSSCPGLKRESTSTRTGSVVSVSGRQIKVKREQPVVETETVPVRRVGAVPKKRTGNTANCEPTTGRNSKSLDENDTNQAEASIPTETVSEDPDLILTSTVCRKAAKRTLPWDLTAEEIKLAEPLSIPARKRRRIEEPLLPPRRSTRRVNTTSSTGTPVPPPSVDTSTSPRSRRKTRLPPIENSEEEVDDDDDDDNGDLSGPSWKDGLSELAEYRKMHGHCNVPQLYNKLDKWVCRQRSNYRVLQKGKTSPMTPFRIQELESLGFEWDRLGTAWEDRLSELADYRKIHGHSNVPRSWSENTQLANWAINQRSNYRKHLAGKTSPMTPFRIQELDSLGFEWGVHATAWEKGLSELTNYNKIYGHCNVARSSSENTNLANWVQHQRRHNRLRLEGKKSPLTPFRIQELESLGFEWGVYATWEDRLSELADYRKLNGHCNVPKNYRENTQLGAWVAKQRYQYKLYLKGKKSHMTNLRFEELKSLGFRFE